MTFFSPDSTYRVPFFLKVSLLYLLLMSCRDLNVKNVRPFQFCKICFCRI